MERAWLNKILFYNSAIKSFDLRRRQYSNQSSSPNFVSIDVQLYIRNVKIEELYLNLSSCRHN